MIDVLTNALSLAFSALLVVTGWHLAKTGAKLRSVIKLAGAALAAYWVVFLPAIVVGRLTGTSDLGLHRIIREALTLGNTTVPFAYHAGGYALAVLLMAVLVRVRKSGPLFAAWLYALMPVSTCAVLRHYFWGVPAVERLLGNLMLTAGQMGVGCALAEGELAGRLDAKLGKLNAGVRRVLLIAAGVLAVAGHFAFSVLNAGELQMVQGRVSFPYPMDMVYAPALMYAVTRGVRVPAAADVSNRKKNAPDGPYFAKKTTDVLKGISLIMMFAHHILLFPEWLLPGMTPMLAEGVEHVARAPLAMCVPVFACLTGYFAALQPKTFAQSAQKALRVLVPYWIIQVLLFALAAATGAGVTLRGFVAELFGVESVVMLFNWYICFYWMAMLMLPLLMKLPHGHVLSAAGVFIVLPLLAATAVRALSGYDSYMQHAAQAMLDGVCALGAGVIVGKFSLFTRGMDVVLGKRRGVRLVLCAVLALGTAMARYYAPRLIVALPWGGEAWQVRVSMDFFYAPVFVFAMVNLIKACPVRAVNVVLGELGRYSMHMWLLHCAFFNVSKEALMPVLYAPGNPVLVTLWCLLLCYIAARIVDVPIRFVMRKIRL